MPVENCNLYMKDVSNVKNVLTSKENMSEQRGMTSKRSEWRRLAARLGSQGSVTSISESEDDDEMHSQHSLADVELMMMPARPLAALDSAFLTPVPAKIHGPTPKSGVSMQHNKSGYLGTTNVHSTLTPKKAGSSGGTIDPLTPTSNLKMLSCVASPEIRQRDELRALEDVDDEAAQENADQVSFMAMQQLAYQTAATQPSEAQHLAHTTLDMEQQPADSLLPTISRKEKSLGLLCQRFLARYPEYPTNYNHLEICLDEVAKDLSVERRRIYDIVNVLESVEIVSRLAKNRYVWHGKSRLSETLSKLKALAKLEGFAEQIEMVKDFEVSRDLEAEQARTSKSVDICSASASPQHHRVSCENALTETMRKEKSLGIMSQKFLMLFLVSQPKTVNLDISAKILIGNPNVDRTENGKFKTKIRRLYDIANILTSLDLIRKVHVTEVRGRKPAFKYVGPEVYDINNIEVVCSCDVGHRSSSKHSLLDCIQNRSGNLTPISKSFESTDSQSISAPLIDLPTSADGNRRHVKPGKATPLSRHASFEVICEVAAQERNRLYYESRSQPTSPTDTRTATGTNKPIVSQRPASSQMQTLPVAGSGMKHLMLIRDSSKVAQSDVNSESNVLMGRKNITSNLKANTTVHKIPIDDTVLTTVAGRQDGIAQHAGPVDVKHSTVMTLTKEQLDSLIKTISVGSEKQAAVAKAPPPLRNVCYVDAATQSSPQLPATLLSFVESNKTAAVQSELRKRLSTDEQKSEEKRHKQQAARQSEHALVPTTRPDVEVANIIQQGQCIRKPPPATADPRCRSQTPTLRISSSSLPVMLLKKRPASLGANNSLIDNGVDTSTVTLTRPLSAASCHSNSQSSERSTVQSSIQPTLQPVAQTDVQPSIQHAEHGQSSLSTAFVDIESLHLLPYLWSPEYSDNKVAPAGELLACSMPSVAPCNLPANMPATAGLPAGLLDGLTGGLPVSIADNQAASSPIPSNVHSYPTSQLVNYAVGNERVMHWSGGQLISPDSFFRNTPSTAAAAPLYSDVSSAFVSVGDSTSFDFAGVPRRLSMNGNLYQW